MASLKDLRNRIASVKATRKITKAMQMVAAAKLRRAQEAATAARPYADRMDQMMASLGARVTDRAGSEISVTVIRPSDRGTQGVHRPKLGGFGPVTVEPQAAFR